MCSVCNFISAVATAPSPRGVLVGLGLPNKAPSAPNWNLKHKSVEFCQIWISSPPAQTQSLPIDDFLATVLSCHSAIRRGIKLLTVWINILNNYEKLRAHFPRFSNFCVLCLNWFSIWYGFIVFQFNLLSNKNSTCSWISLYGSGHGRYTLVPNKNCIYKARVLWQWEKFWLINKYFLKASYASVEWIGFSSIISFSHIINYCSLQNSFRKLRLCNFFLISFISRLP